MKQRVAKQLLLNPLELLRKAGYYPFTDPHTGESSFILRLGPEQYPRMHLYVEEHGDDWSFNLHIDQKKASYAGTSRHSGEYEGPLVEREMTRICKWITAETGVNIQDTQQNKNSTSQEKDKKQDLTPSPRKPFGGIF